MVLNKPVVGMAVDPATGGYWLVASDGGIFSFHAPFLGSTGNIVLNQPIVGRASPSGAGYRFVAADGGVFAYGAAFYGTPVFASAPAPTPAPGPTPSGIQASFNCTGSVSNGTFFVASWTKARPGLVLNGGYVSLPWSGTLALTPTDGFVVLSAEPVPNSQTALPSWSGTCSTTVTWPGGSATQTGSFVPGEMGIWYAKVCSNYPVDSGWVACPPGSDNG